MILHPLVIETVGRTKKTFDIPSKLYDQGIITLFSGIDDDLAYSIITQLLYLDTIKTDDPVNMYINSGGGSVYAGLAIIDTINNMKRKVNTVGIGICASMGASLLFAGTGVRSVLPNTRIMIHSVSSGTGGTVHDQIIDLEETKYLQEKLMIMAADWSKGIISYDEVVEMTLRDKYLSPEQTLTLGLIDKIV